MRADEVKAVLESLGKRPNKHLGQNFMLNDSVLRDMVRHADVNAGDRVLEIGPGIGNLTDELVRAGAKVAAVETDDVFVKFLGRRFGDRVTVLHADAVKAFLPEFDKVVSNLPYQISSPITFKLLDAGFKVAVLMVQKEFAERMVAKPGTDHYCRLSVGVYFRAQCEIVMGIPRHFFWPQPKVDSCVVRLVPRPPPFKVQDADVFIRVTQAVFSHRRKMISNSLARDPAVSDLVGGIDAETLRGLPHAERRPEELSPEQIGELADAVLDLSRSVRRTA